VQFHCVASDVGRGNVDMSVQNAELFVEREYTHEEFVPQEDWLRGLSHDTGPNRPVRLIWDGNESLPMNRIEKRVGRRRSPWARCPPPSVAADSAGAR